MASVTLKAVVKRFGEVTVIPRIDLEIHDRELIVFVGPSGCGKSTLLRIVAGLEPLDEGEVWIGERCVNAVPPAQRDIAMVFQDYALYPHMSVYGNMAFGLEMRNMPRSEIDQRVKHAAGLLHIGDYLQRKPKELSGGQRQRVAMGRAMVRNPQVFLFDEPLSNLDAKLRAEVRTEIKALAQALQTTLVYVTHDQVEAMTMADRIVILKAGVVQQVGTPQEVYRLPVNQFVAGFIGSPTMNFFKVRHEGEGLRLADGTALPLDAVRLARVAAHAGAPLVLGVRSEHLGLARPGEAGLAVTVSVVEPLGSDSFVYFDFDGARHVARVAPEATPKPGDLIRLAVQMSHAHLFDGANGEALR